jgi:hypothetical protein
LVDECIASKLRSAKPETLARVRVDLVESGISAQNADKFIGTFRNGDKAQESIPSVHSLVQGKPVSSGHVNQPSLLPIPKPALKSSPVLVNRKPSAVHPLGYPVRSLSKAHQTYIGAAFFGGDQNEEGHEVGRSLVEDDRPAPLPSALPSSSSLLSSLRSNTLNTLTRPRTCTRVDIDIDSERSSINSTGEVASMEREVTSFSAIARRSHHRQEQTVAPCAARAAKKQVPLIPVQLTPRAQECLDEMRRLGGPFEEMDQDSLDSIAAESDKLLRASKDLVCTVKAYYAWWTTAAPTKRHKDTRRGWMRWVVTADSGIYDRKPFTPQTWEQRRAEGAERVRMLARIRERARCKQVNDERRRLGQPIKEGYDDWDPEVAGLKEEDYQ